MRDNQRRACWYFIRVESTADMRHVSIQGLQPSDACIRRLIASQQSDSIGPFQSVLQMRPTNASFHFLETKGSSGGDPSEPNLSQDSLHFSEVMAGGNGMRRPMLELHALAQPNS